MGSPAAMRAAALRRTSSLTGTDSQPDSRSSPMVVGRCRCESSDMATTLPASSRGGGAPPPRAPADGNFRTWLQLDGLFYQGDVWLDGSYLGDTEGYFFPHVFEATDALAPRSDHLLALELTCDRPSNKAAKGNLTGV